MSGRSLAVACLLLAAVEAAPATVDVIETPHWRGAEQAGTRDECPPPAGRERLTAKGTGALRARPLREWNWSTGSMATAPTRAAADPSGWERDLLDYGTPLAEPLGAKARCGNEGDPK